jgi:hypothetical protein
MPRDAPGRQVLDVVELRIQQEGSMRSFRARNTSGKVVEIVDDSDMSASDLGSSDRETRRGLPTLRTAIGQRVNKLGPGRYEVVDSKEMLTSDDPSAV